jgi:hypothetical protein
MISVYNELILFSCFYVFDRNFVQVFFFRHINNLSIRCNYIRTISWLRLPLLLWVAHIYKHCPLSHSDSFSYPRYGVWEVKKSLVK